MDAIAGAGVFAGADGVSGWWELHGGALPLQTTPPKAGGPLETGFFGCEGLAWNGDSVGEYLFSTDF